MESTSSISFNKSRSSISVNKSKSSKKKKKVKCNICRTLMEYKFGYQMLFRALVFKYSSNTLAYKKSIHKYIFEQRRRDMILFKYNISYEDEGEYL